MTNINTFNWQKSLIVTYEEFATQFITFAPHLIAAVALLVVGWFVAHGLRIVTKKLIGSFDALFNRVAKTDGVRQKKIKHSYAIIISRVVFWTVIIFFLSATSNILGWKMFSNWMSSVITYLPNLITGLVIILGGFLLGNVAKSGVISAAHSTEIEQSEILARIVQIIILFTTFVIGIEQIGINLYFLTNTLIVVLGVLTAGAAIAFGLGAKTLIANIIGAQYIQKHCRISEKLQIGDVTGNITEVTQTSIVIETETGRAVIPAKCFQEQISRFISNKDETIKSDIISVKKEPQSEK